MDLRGGESIARFGRDIVVIIVGVLIALGFDNWTTGRGERRLEREYLTRLSRDLRADSAMLAEQRRVAAIGEAASIDLLVLLDSSVSAPDSVLGRYFSDATRGAYLTANNPTIVELQTTGNLRVLRDEALRDALLTYYARTNRFQFSLETVMRRGKDPLGELGWDLQAYDGTIAYAANLGTTPPELLATRAHRVQAEDLITRLRAHPDAARLIQRAVTYNAMLQPILVDWELALERARERLDDSR